jgi:hypothetical protein
MIRISRLRLVLVATVAVAAAVPTLVGMAAAGSEHSVTAATKPATARYHDLSKAEAAGYGLLKDAAGIACIDNQPVGGMGVHYVKGSLVGDTVLDPEHPEALVYAPNAAGKLKLAALEYIVFKAAWEDAGHTSLPSLFGQEFNLTPSPNRFGLPAFYSLHAWVWEPNSSGLLQPWNPRVHC